MHPMYSVPYVFWNNHFSSERFLGWTLILTTIVTLGLGAWIENETDNYHAANRQNLIHYDRANLASSKRDSVRVLGRLLSTTGTNTPSFPIDVELPREAYMYHLLVNDEKFGFEDKEERQAKLNEAASRDIQSVTDFFRQTGDHFEENINNRTSQLIQEAEDFHRRQSTLLYWLNFFQLMNLLLAIRFTYVSYHIAKTIRPGS
ncbi:MAG: hypothetical protein GEV13_00850 [Rhodospirillales bacterium]|nr:hypothetical protein [Rhodospirillales bacterium]